MAADDHNEQFDNAEVTGTFTDPAGVAHTSELADIEDVGQTGVVLENVDGTTFMTTRTLTAGNGCEWADDADGTATLNVTVSGGTEDTNTHVDAQNADGTLLAESIPALREGTDIGFAQNADGSVSVNFVGDAATDATAPARATASGDDATATFELPNPLTVVPSAVDVTAASEDACADFFLSDKTSDVVRITYPRAPPAGTDNLEWELIAHE